MSRILKWTWGLALVLAAFALGILLADKYYLRTEVIRLRVVAQSDSPEDQCVKIAVRDAINDYLCENPANANTAGAAKQFLQDHKPQLESVANTALRAVGSESLARVYFTKEQADTRHYDTFSLPAGVYETLRVDIGDAQGANWWCVVFPSLCQPASVKAFEETALEAGFYEGLPQTLAQEKGYRIRFFLLDCLGRFEKIFLQ